MDWITESVAIGTSLEAQDRCLLEANCIQSILSLDGSVDTGRAAELGLAEVVMVPLLDGSGNTLDTFRTAVGALERLAQTHAPILVQCQYGRSRSPAVVAGYLIASRGLDPFEARDFIAARREISISAALLPLLFQL